jgi:carboxylate-amine ligase
MTWRIYGKSLLNENKQRAARFGTGAKLIDFGRGEEVQYTELLEELLEFIDDVVDELGSRNEINYAREIVRRGTGADRQLAVYAERNDLNDVVDYIVRETEHGVG